MKGAAGLGAQLRPSGATSNRCTRRVPAQARASGWAGGAGGWVNGCHQAVGAGAGVPWQPRGINARNLLPSCGRAVLQRSAPRGHTAPRCLPRAPDQRPRPCHCPHARPRLHPTGILPTLQMQQALGSFLQEVGGDEGQAFIRAQRHKVGEGAGGQLILLQQAGGRAGRQAGRQIASSSLKAAGSTAQVVPGS